MESQSQVAFIQLLTDNLELIEALKQRGQIINSGSAEDKLRRMDAKIDKLINNKRAKF